MLWFFITMIAVALSAVITAGVMAPTRRFALRIVAVVLASALLIVAVVVWWKYAIVAAAIATVCSLAIGVMFQKVKPAQAVAGAIVAFVLMFVFSWLALQMADPLLFNEDSELTHWLTGLFSTGGLYDNRQSWSPGLTLALVVFGLVVAYALRRWFKPILITALFLFVIGSVLIFLDQSGINLTELFSGNDPTSRLASLLLLFGVIVVAAKLIINSNRPKNP